MPRARRVLAVLSAGALTACMTTKVRRAPDWPTEPAVPTLMVAGTVEHAAPTNANASAGGAVLDGMATVFGNLDVDAFGATVASALTPWLARNGVALTMDPPRARSLQSVQWGDAANAVTVLTGMWVDPNGAAMRVGGDTLFRGFTLRRVGETLNTPAAPEGFAFTVVTVYDDTEWLMFRRPLVRVSVLVADDTGREVLRARAWGAGSRTAFLIDRSEGNLAQALSRALERLKAAEVQPLP
jgi:hypothetical protein